MSVPAVVLDTTMSGETANSYVDVPTCDDYWTNHWNTAAGQTWLDLNTQQKTNLLMQACRVVETVRCVGPYIKPQNHYRLEYSMRTGTVLTLPLDRDITRFYWYQRLQFPRNIDIYVTEGNGLPYIPYPVIFAQCEQAVYTATFDYSALQNRMQGITLEKIVIGKNDIGISHEYNLDGSSLSPVAKEMLQPFMLGKPRLRRS